TVRKIGLYLGPPTLVPRICRRQVRGFLAAPTDRRSRGCPTCRVYTWGFAYAAECEYNLAFPRRLTFNLELSTVDPPPRQKRGATGVPAAPLDWSNQVQRAITCCGLWRWRCVWLFSPSPRVRASESSCRGSCFP